MVKFLKEFSTGLARLIAVDSVEKVKPASATMLVRGSFLSLIWNKRGFCRHIICISGV